MYKKKLYEILNEMGLSKRKSDIYILLSRKGFQKLQNISSILGIDRAQTYRLLQSLKNDGILEETIESPIRYGVIPIQELIDDALAHQKHQTAKLQSEKPKAIKYFKAIEKGKSARPEARFQILVNKNSIYAKISHLANGSKKEFLWLTTNKGLPQEDMFGVIDNVLQVAHKKKRIKFKILTNVSKENLRLMKNIVKRTSVNNKNVNWRHAKIGSSYYTSFAIKDDTEILLYTTNLNSPLPDKKIDSALWISSKMFVSTLKPFLMELWHDATEIEKRLEEVKTGIPLEVTLILKESYETKKKIKKVLNAAKHEIVLITTSVILTKILDEKLIHNVVDRNVRIRIMAPVDMGAIEKAKFFSSYYELRDVSIGYLTMMLVDKKHLFIFKSPQVLKGKSSSPFNLRNTFYTNDMKYVERASELLDDIWKRGTPITQMSNHSPSSISVKVLDSSTLDEVVRVMLQNDVTSVMVTKDDKVIGIIDYRDLLKNFVKTKTASNTLASEIVSLSVLMTESELPLKEALKTINNKRGVPRLAVIKEEK